MKISVCMASYNGAKFINSQISSILMQLGEKDELIISDDGSTDDTIKIIKSFNDDRIILLNHQNNNKKRKHVYPHYLVSANFENALKNCNGDIIFLSDQDDIWAENKIEIMLPYFKDYNLVMSDCYVIDNEGAILADSFFAGKNVTKGTLKNIMRPIYQGCCIGFRKDVLDIALPFPHKLILHDNWLGILSEHIGKNIFINEKLIFYRRHFENSSFIEGKSKNSIFFRVKYRIELLYLILKRLILFKIKKGFFN